MTSLTAFSATAIDGQDVDLSTYDGQVVLVVNTASECGFTPQYQGLQTLHDQYADRGFAVLGFPCDQFGHQEPGDEAEIASFCERNYGVTFPMFAKVDVNGEAATRCSPGCAASRSADRSSGTSRSSWSAARAGWSGTSRPASSPRR